MRAPACVSYTSVDHSAQFRWTHTSRSRFSSRAGPSVIPSPNWWQKQQRLWSRSETEGRKEAPNFFRSSSILSSSGSWEFPLGTTTWMVHFLQRRPFCLFPWCQPSWWWALGRAFSFTVTLMASDLVSVLGVSFAMGKGMGEVEGGECLGWSWARQWTSSEDMLLLYWCWALERLSFCTESGRGATDSWKDEMKPWPSCPSKKEMLY